MSSVVNKMSNGKFPYSFSAHMLVGMCVYNKEMSWFRNMITYLYNAVSAPVAAKRDALSERLESVRDTASLLYNRAMHHIGETLKNIVGNAAKEEEDKRVLPKWLRKKRCINALDTFDDNLCV